MRCTSFSLSSPVERLVSHALALAVFYVTLASGCLKSRLVAAISKTFSGPFGVQEKGQGFYTVTLFIMASVNSPLRR